MNQQRTGILKKIGLMLTAVGPGIFMIGYNIGTGSVTNMASAGSRYGMSIFWVLLLSCLFTFVMLVAYGQFTLVTGDTSLRGYKKHLPYGNWIALYSIFVLSLGEFLGLAGVMGVVSELVREWSRILFGGEGFSMILIAAVILSGCYYLLWVGKYSRFEKVLIAFVVIMGLSFVLSMFMVIPDPKDLLTGMIPGIPDEPNAFLIIAGMTGTTCGAIVFVMRSIIVAEKGWTINDLRQEKIDAFVSASLMLIISGAIMACAAGTLYRMGTPVERAVDMVKTLEPIAGRFAISIFVVGIISAGISTVFPIALILPWLICDYRGIERNIQSPMFRILGGLGLLAGLTVPVLGGRPVFVMIASSAFQATIMPVTTLAIMVMVNSKKIMGEHRAGFWLNTGMFATLIYAFITTYMGVVGLIDTFSPYFN
ncbi:MAG: Nramp family divalent metal transporter [Candidatus Latescibacteria bacterium]|nr:Nramp family divalent metal transporter [Candidatus Latescibacterota bacterium]